MVASRSAAKKTATEVTSEQESGTSADEPGDGSAGEGDENSVAEHSESSGGTKKTSAVKTSERTEKSAAKTSAATTETVPKKTKKVAKKAAKKTEKKSARHTGAPEADVQQTGARTVAAKKTTTEKPSAVPQARNAAAVPGELAVRSGEEPWTVEEVEEARAELEDEAGLRRSEITASEEALTGLMRDSGDGAGDDQADTGSKNITREHELALAGNAREMLYQIERALARLEAGTYGLCENCGNPIGKARMQAFPRATLCVECKQRQERR